MEHSPSPRGGDLEAILPLWERLTALLGTATASALLRRALAQLDPASPVRAAVRVEREGRNFVCRLIAPPPGEHASELVALGRTLSTILRELTGAVAIRYLASDPDLAVFEFAEEGP